MNKSFQALQIKVHSLRTRLQKLAEDPEGEWKTVNGRHVFIGKGQSFDDALKQSLAGKGDDGKAAGSGDVGAHKGVSHVLGSLSKEELKGVRYKLVKSGLLLQSRTDEGKLSQAAAGQYGTTPEAVAAYLASNGAKKGLRP